MTGYDACMQRFYLLLDLSPWNFKAKLKLLLPYMPDSFSNQLDSGTFNLFSILK